MIAMVAYYVGLLVLIIALILTPFLSEKREKQVSCLLFFAMIYYWFLGLLFFGWKLAVANIFIVIVVGNLLDIPMELLVKKFFPHAKFRWAIDSAIAQKSLAVADLRSGYVRSPTFSSGLSKITSPFFPPNARFG